MMHILILIIGKTTLNTTLTQTTTTVHLILEKCVALSNTATEHFIVRWCHLVVLKMNHITSISKLRLQEITRQQHYNDMMLFSSSVERDSSVWNIVKWCFVCVLGVEWGANYGPKYLFMTVQIFPYRYQQLLLTFLVRGCTEWNKGNYLLN